MRTGWGKNEDPTRGHQRDLFAEGTQRRSRHGPRSFQHRICLQTAAKEPRGAVVTEAAHPSVQREMPGARGDIPAMVPSPFPPRMLRITLPRVPAWRTAPAFTSWWLWWENPPPQTSEVKKSLIFPTTKLVVKCRGAAAR